MKTVVCFVITVLMAYGNSFALPVQWKVEDGGNGNYYEVVDAGYQITWLQARDAAIARGGYLSCITSAEENVFVSNLISDLKYWSGWDHVFGPWIGGMQLPGSVEPSGGWCWVSGEDFVYSNWTGGEPNNDGGIYGNENAIHFVPGDFWNDLVNGYRNVLPTAYVVEEVPEPATIALLCLGGLLRRRKK